LTSVFVVKDPLYLVALSREEESEGLLRKQLDLIYSQILFSVPIIQLKSIFEKYPNFDLRQMLRGNKKANFRNE
jgi:hypothetical protein